MTALAIVNLVSGIVSYGGAAVSAITYVGSEVFLNKVNKLNRNVPEDENEKTEQNEKVNKLIKKALILKKVSDISGCASIVGSITGIGCTIKSRANQKINNVNNVVVPEAE